MKKNILVISGFVFIFAVGMVLNMPSVQLLRWIAIPSNIQVQGITGSVRKGNIVQIGVESVQLNDIEYSFQPTCLIFLSICYQLKSDTEGLQAKLGINAVSKKLSLTDVRFQASPDLLDSIPGLLVKPSGNIDLSLEKATFSKGKIGIVRGYLNWDNAGIEGDATIFGNYRAEFQLDQAGILEIDSSQGSALIVTGELNFERTGNYKADLKFESSPNLQASVKSLLESTLEQTGLDQYRFRRDGRLEHQLMKLM